MDWVGLAEGRDRYALTVAQNQFLTNRDVKISHRLHSILTRCGECPYVVRQLSTEECECMCFFNVASVGLYGVICLRPDL
jgi:hypothetical protein